MKRYSFLFTAIVLLLVSGFTAAAQEACSRVSVYFEASEDTILDGKLAVGYEQTGGGQYGFVDFWLDEEAIDSGEDFLIGAFNITGIESFRIWFVEAQLDIDGDGRFYRQIRDCSSPLPADDGRLNLDDPASLAIVYRNSRTGGFDVYLVNTATGGGDLVIRAARADIDAARAAAMGTGGVNMLIGAGETVSLWALTSGECQRNAFYPDGKPDVFIFACAAAGG